MAAIKPCFSPHVCAVGSKWREMIVGRFSIGGQQYEPTYLYAELVALDFNSGKATVQYWLADVKGGLVERRISELPVIAGDIDTSYRRPFSSKDFRKLQGYNEFESVTAASDDESVTGVCQVCGGVCSPRAKTCGASCRKRLSRMKH